MVYKGRTKPNYYVVSKEKIRGHHVVTPYASRPKNDSKHVVVSGDKMHYKLNKNGYAITKTLPTKGVLKSKPKKRPNEFSLLNVGAAFGYRGRRL